MKNTNEARIQKVRQYPSPALYQSILGLCGWGGRGEWATSRMFHEALSSTPPGSGDSMVMDLEVWPFSDVRSILARHEPDEELRALLYDYLLLWHVVSGGIQQQETKPAAHVPRLLDTPSFSYISQWLLKLCGGGHPRDLEAHALKPLYLEVSMSKEHGHLHPGLALNSLTKWLFGDEAGFLIDKPGNDAAMKSLTNTGLEIMLCGNKSLVSLLPVWENRWIWTSLMVEDTLRGDKHKYIASDTLGTIAHLRDLRDLTSRITIAQDDLDNDTQTQRSVKTHHLYTPLTLLGVQQGRTDKRRRPLTTAEVTALNAGPVQFMDDVMPIMHQTHDPFDPVVHTYLQRVCQRMGELSYEVRAMQRVDDETELDLCKSVCTLLTQIKSNAGDISRQCTYGSSVVTSGFQPLFDQWISGLQVDGGFNMYAQLMANDGKRHKPYDFVSMLRGTLEHIALRTIMEARLSALIWAGTTPGILEAGLPPRHELPLWLPLRYFNPFMLDAPPLIAVFGAGSGGTITHESSDWRDELHGR